MTEDLETRGTWECSKCGAGAQFWKPTKKGTAAATVSAEIQTLLDKFEAAHEAKYHEDAT